MFRFDHAGANFVDVDSMLGQANGVQLRHHRQSRLAHAVIPRLMLATLTR